ncbi:hypothetical protein PCE1_004722 [Barthelona sp. PCE]
MLGNGTNPFLSFLERENEETESIISGMSVTGVDVARRRPRETANTNEAGSTTSTTPSTDKKFSTGINRLKNKIRSLQDQLMDSDSVIESLKAENMQVKNDLELIRRDNVREKANLERYVESLVAKQQAKATSLAGKNKKLIEKIEELTEKFSLAKARYERNVEAMNERFDQEKKSVRKAVRVSERKRAEDVIKDRLETVRNNTIKDMQLHIEKVLTSKHQELELERQKHERELETIRLNAQTVANERVRTARVEERSIIDTKLLEKDTYWRGRMDEIVKDYEQKMTNLRKDHDRQITEVVSMERASFLSIRKGLEEQVRESRGKVDELTAELTRYKRKVDSIILDEKRLIVAGFEARVDERVAQERSKLELAFNKQLVEERSKLKTKFQQDNETELENIVGQLTKRMEQQIQTERGQLNTRIVEKTEGLTLRIADLEGRLSKANSECEELRRTVRSMRNQSKDALSLEERLEVKQEQHSELNDAYMALESNFSQYKMAKEKELVKLRRESAQQIQSLNFDLEQAIIERKNSESDKEMDFAKKMQHVEAEVKKALGLKDRAIITLRTENDKLLQELQAVRSQLQDNFSELIDASMLE